MRLDHYLVASGLAETRSKAQQMISSGSVSVEGSVVKKAAFAIEAQKVEVLEPLRYVSRAALKLAGFLPELPFVCKGLHALDIGASTGGFTQVLLEAGARAVEAVDVGTGQLHALLKTDPRVMNREQTDIRHFDPGRRYALVTSDVSFIALHHILDDIDRLSEQWIVMLFKPQFEVGKEARRDRRGVVIDANAVEQARTRFEAACAQRGWRLVRQAAAAITGKEGNSEICYCYEKG